MKPTSIIFLIVAVVLALGGFVTMKIAEGFAAKEGVEIINKTDVESGDYVFTYDYSADEIGKISISVKDADIHVFGSSEKAYIELINFADGTYEFTSANRIITLNNNSDLSSITSIATMALNFRGLRSLVNYVNVSGREKVINIYLTDEEPVKMLGLTTEKGTVTVDGVPTATDYSMSIGTGTLMMKNITTTSSILLSLEKGEAVLDNCKAKTLTAEIGTGDLTLLTSELFTLTADIKNGDFTCGFRSDFAYVNLDLSAGVGTVTVDGEGKGGSYISDPLPTDSKIKVTLGAGDIKLNSKMQAPEPDKTDETGSTDTTSSDTNKN